MFGTITTHLLVRSILENWPKIGAVVIHYITYASFGSGEIPKIGGGGVPQTLPTFID